jgi:ATP-binding cassette subfamily C protein
VTFGALIRDSWDVNGWKLPLLISITFVSAVLEGLTVTALLPLLSSLGVPSLSSSTDRVSWIVVHILTSIGQQPTTFKIGVLVAALIAASAGVFLMQAYATSRLHSAYIASWQQRLFSAFLEADFSFFRHRRASDLIAAATTEPVRLGLGFVQMNLIVTSLLFVVVQLAIAVFVAPLVVLLLAVMAASLFLFTRALAARALSIGRATTELNADLLADASELLSGAKFVKATSTESRALTRLFSIVSRLEAISFRNSMDGQLVRAAFEYPGGLAMVGLIVAGPLFLGVDVGAILVIVAMFVRLLPRISGLRQSMQILSVCLPALETTTRLLQEAKAQTEGADLVEPEGWSHHGPVGVKVQDVSVSSEDQMILRNVTFEIPAGTLVAITGATGSGKTTLLDCILGLRKPSTGSIFVDGKSLSTLPSKLWRSGIGYLGQDPILFNSSIADNLRWIRPETSDEEIYEALRAAAAGFVEHLPQGLNTMVGDHGSRLSGGERQRIALARALIGSPRIVVLDEATSSLDVETEEKVTRALAALKGRITIIAITHRPALAREADLVIQLENGCIEKCGPAPLQFAI